MAQKSGKKSAPATAGDVVMLVLGAVIALALSLLPPLLGPMIAPRSLTVIASVLCSGEPTAARTEIVATRSRNKTSYNWVFHCGYADGRVERASGTHSMLGAWLLFNGAGLLSFVLAARMYNALRRRVWGAPSR
jgi:hypothetical protein